MATPLNPPSTSDIGPLSDSSSLGEPGRAPASDAAAASARKPRADSGTPVIEPADESPGDEPPREFNGSGATNGDPAALSPERAPAAAENKKEPTAGPETPLTPPPIAPGEEIGRQEAREGKPWPALDYSKQHDEVEAELLERMRAKYGTALVSDMDDAQLLLSYVTRNGLQEERKINDETIQTLIASREHMRSFLFDSENEEAKFRKSCGIIAKAAEPVTVASLRDSTTTEPYISWLGLVGMVFKPLAREPQRRPIAEIACLRYRLWAIVVLVVLLVVQIYWTISSSVLNDAEALITELNKAPTKQFYLEQEAAKLMALNAAAQQNTSTPPAATTPGSSPVSSPQPTANEAKTHLALDELVSKMGELDASYWMLSKLVLRDAPRRFPTINDGTSDLATERPVRTAETIFAPTRFQIDSAAIRTIAGQVVDVLQKWVLPLLYGALGAMVFVVRTLSVQARDRLFRKEALVSLVLRVFLGMISGLAIGWFWSNDPQGATTEGPMSLSTLSPFALAFVAGYGVELFFALLDKIVSTFTNK